jgi:DNA-binding transcriptional LysR family regulator
VISAALFSQALLLQAAMRKAMPAVRIEWQVESSANQVEALRQHRLDLGLVHTPIEHEGLALRLVMREPLVVAVPASHPLARRTSIPLRALKDEVFVVATRDRVPSYYDRFIAACHAAGFEPRLAHQRQTMVNFLGLVAIGAGVTVVPVSVMRVAVEGTRYVRLSGDVPRSELSVVWSPANRSPVLARALRLMPRR